MGKNDYYKRRNAMRAGQNGQKSGEARTQEENGFQNKPRNDIHKESNEVQKDNSRPKSFRDQKWNNRNNNYKNARPRTVETVNDIAEDIKRIEKEIKIEIEEIRTIKL